MENLLKFPLSGRIVAELENPRYREILIKNYRVIYSIADDAVYVLIIRHQMQSSVPEEMK
jgi:plasmid stabilization system protein ParE